LFVILGLFAVFTITAQAPAQKLIIFDAPGAGTGPNQGTSPSGISLEGTTTGNVIDSGYGIHGFVRTPEGQFTNFDAPGADAVAGCTCPTAINDFGVVAGYSIDTSLVIHGWVRARDGKITVFDPPGAGTGTYQGVQLVSINNIGAVAGAYTDGNNVAHGFVRAADGKFTVFDDPAGGTGAFQGTWAYSINDFGVIVGATTYSDNSSHGLLRTFKGSYPDFQFPTTTNNNAAWINDLGVIAGSYARGNNTDFAGFQRTPDGKMTEYSAPGAGPLGTFVYALNLQGTVTGYVEDSNNEAHSFIRYANGRIVEFDVPGQMHVPGTGLGSAGLAINALGQVAGHLHDPGYAVHAYLRLPEE
jgi:hypothetical protein